MLGSNCAFIELTVAATFPLVGLTCRTVKLPDTQGTSLRITHPVLVSAFLASWTSAPGCVQTNTVPAFDAAFTSCEGKKELRKTSEQLAASVFFTNFNEFAFNIVCYSAWA